MNWNKAGRPSKKKHSKGTKNKSNKSNTKYTKTELTIYKHGTLALAVHVIRQWHEDGEPVDDDISLFKDIINLFGGKV